MIRRILVLGAVACAMLAVGLTAPAGAQTGYQGCNVTLSDTTPTAGETITVSGTGATPNHTVVASIGGVTIGSGQADGTGAFSFLATIPAGVSGTVVVNVDCNAENPNSVVEGVTITVGAGGGGTGEPLPVTGSSSTLPLTKLAVVLLSAGALMLVVSRRRSTKSVKTEV
jgi:LPXTG-motif cell wall-anchored protein